MVQSVLRGSAPVLHQTHPSMSKFHSESLAVDMIRSVAQLLQRAVATYRSDSVTSMSVSHVSKPSSTKAS